MAKKSYKEKTRSERIWDQVSGNVEGGRTWDHKRRQKGIPIRKYPDANIPETLGAALGDIARAGIDATKFGVDKTIEGTDQLIKGADWVFGRPARIAMDATGDAVDAFSASFTGSEIGTGQKNKVRKPISQPSDPLSQVQSTEDKRTNMRSSAIQNPELDAFPAQGQNMDGQQQERSPIVGNPYDIIAEGDLGVRRGDIHAMYGRIPEMELRNNIPSMDELANKQQYEKEVAEAQAKKQSQENNRRRDWILNQIKELNSESNRSRLANMPFFERRQEIGRQRNMLNTLTNMDTNEAARHGNIMDHRAELARQAQESKEHAMDSELDWMKFKEGVKQNWAKIGIEKENTKYLIKELESQDLQSRANIANYVTDALNKWNEQFEMNNPRPKDDKEVKAYELRKKNARREYLRELQKIIFPDSSQQGSGTGKTPEQLLAEMQTGKI